MNWSLLWCDLSVSISSDEYQIKTLTRHAIAFMECIYIYHMRANNARRSDFARNYLYPHTLQTTNALLLVRLCFAPAWEWYFCSPYIRRFIRRFASASFLRLANSCSKPHSYFIGKHTHKRSTEHFCCCSRRTFIQYKFSRMTACDGPRH